MENPHKSRGGFLFFGKRGTRGLCPLEPNRRPMAHELGGLMGHCSVIGWSHQATASFRATL